MNNSKVLVWAALLLISLASSGCLRPKAGGDPVRSYVLSPLPGDAGAPNGLGRDLSLGIAPVQIPGYLWDSRIALRRGESEIRYYENHRWAERLDRGLQRVLGDNLALLLDSGRVVLSAWSRQSVQAQLHLFVERFEADDSGQVRLDTRWRIASPGGDETFLTKRSQIVRQMPLSARDVPTTVAELSKALADLSREIAAALPKAVAPASAP